MLKIDRLRISLPPGYESRADRIARLVADELASLQLQGNAQFDRLALPAIEVGPRATDRQVASSIAGAMASHLKDLKDTSDNRDASFSGGKP